MTPAEQLEAWVQAEAAKYGPRWMQAYGNYCRNDYPGSGVTFAARSAASAEMHEIEAANEVGSPPTPPTSFDLTPVHDAARCRARRLAVETAKAEKIRAVFDARLSSGALSQGEYDSAMPLLRARLAALGATSCATY